MFVHFEDQKSWMHRKKYPIELKEEREQVLKESWSQLFIEKQKLWCFLVNLAVSIFYNFSEVPSSLTLLPLPSVLICPFWIGGGKGGGWAERFWRGVNYFMVVVSKECQKRASAMLPKTGGDRLWNVFGWPKRKRSTRPPAQRPVETKRAL